MKKFLCYLALIILIALIATPPLLRAFYKDKEKVVIEDNYAMLSCVKDNYTISSSYKNKEVLNIKFKHIMDDPNLISKTDTNSLEYMLYFTIKDDATMSKEEGIIKNANNEEIRTISYYLVYANASSSTIAELSDYKLSLDEQKKLYENAGYTCNVIDG